MLRLMGSYGGDLIREARRRRGLTQQELASSAGTAQPGIARWESGRTAVSLDDVMRPVRLCGVDLELHTVARGDSDIVQAARPTYLAGQQRLHRHARIPGQLREIPPDHC